MATLNLSICKLLIAISMLTEFANCGQQPKSSRLLSKRHQDKDFAPRLIHQPHSVVVQPNRPHTSECPVESQPDSEVKWFKDNRLLASEPMHMEQTGSELMFFAINDNDTGDYHCEASNYLGTIASEQFRLTVQSSELDENIIVEPRVYVASEQQDQPVEFKCILPAQLIRTRQARWPEVVSWRKNGKRLQQIVWLNSIGSDSQSVPSSSSSSSSSSVLATGDSGSESEQQDTSLSSVTDRRQQQQQRARQSTTGAKYFGRQGDRQNEFILTIASVTRLHDDNSTYTCLYKPNGDEQAAAAGSGEPEALAHESRAALLRVESFNLTPAHNNQQQHPLQPVKLNIPMGAPPPDITSNISLESMTAAPAAADNSSTIALSASSSSSNQTTQLQHDTSATANNGQQQQQPQPPTPRQRVRTSLSETLADLYEIAKPTILIFGVMCLVAVIVLVQFLFVKRRTQENRYTKHHQHHQHHQQANHHHQYQYSSASSSSANSNSNGSGSSNTFAPGNVAMGGGAGADPILSNLLSRTLSAPSASSLSVNASKKYKSYRDHMRKVAAAITSDQQLVEGADYIDANAYFAQQHQQHQQHQHQQQLHYQEPMLSQLFATSSAVPNLYNQSLAAREQARSLLQPEGAEHMRSLGNLAPTNNQLFKQNNFNYGVNVNSDNSKQQRDGNNLDLPVNFGFGRASSSSASSSLAATAASVGPLEAGAASLITTTTTTTRSNCPIAWPTSGGSGQFHANQLIATGGGGGGSNSSKQQAINSSGGASSPSTVDEHYQLVSCSSISPSSTSSIVAGSSSAGNCSIGAKESQNCDTNLSTTVNRVHQQQQQQQQQQLISASKLARESVSSSNHYSTIETNEEEEEQEAGNEDDDDECRYEEVDGELRGDNRNELPPRPTAAAAAASSSSRSISSSFKQQQQQRVSDNNSGVRTNCFDTRGQIKSNQRRLGARAKQQQLTANGTSATSNGANHHDQLSPYAVSSICNNMTQQRQQQSLLPPPPPVTSEAMQALNEQFDINQLMLLDTHCNGQSLSDAPPLPFSLPPPPSMQQQQQHK